MKRVSCKHLIIPFNLQIIVEDSNALDGDELVNVAEDDPDIIIEDNPSTAHDDGPFSTIEDNSSSEYEDQPIGTSDDGLESSYEEGVEEADVAHSEDNEDDIEAEEAELTPEVQIQRELQESRDAENDLPLQLGLHLLNSFQCSSHGETANRHQDIQGLDSHWSLDDLIENMQQVPYILNSPTILLYNSAYRNCSYEWAKLFEGRLKTKSSGNGDSNNDSQEGPERLYKQTDDKPKVCLACTEQPSDARVSQFDIDSTIGFAPSLAFARHGLCLNFAPQFHQNIQSNVHLSMQVIDYSEGRARAKRVPLFKIPHITLGRVIGLEGMSVHVFFPRQWDVDKQTNFPGKLNGNQHGILEQWTNAILLPSLASCLSSDIGQHLRHPYCLHSSAQKHVLMRIELGQTVRTSLTSPFITSYRATPLQQYGMRLYEEVSFRRIASLQIYNLYSLVRAQSFSTRVIQLKGYGTSTARARSTH